MTRKPLALLCWCGALVLGASAVGGARPSKKAAAPAVPAAPPAEVPVLTAARVDGLKVVVAPAAGPAVSIRLLVNLSRLNARHAQAGAGPVTASAALWAGKPGETLAQGGAHPVVDTLDDSVVLGVETVRERWKDDLTAFLRAVSDPALDEKALGAATLRTLSFGPSHNVESILARVQGRTDERDPALFTPDQGARLSLEGAVWHVEEAWSSDRMTLVVVGAVPKADVDTLVEEHFLVPPLAVPPTPSSPPGTRMQPEDSTGHGPSYLVVGQYARDIPPQHAVVLAAVLQARVDAETPRAGACAVRYVPSAVEPTVLLGCAAVNGAALDVRETLLRALEPNATPPTPAELKAARQAAVGALTAENASAPLLATRLCAWATAGLDGGEGLMAAVSQSPDEALLASWTRLVEPQRALRVLHRGQGGIRP